MATTILPSGHLARRPLPALSIITAAALVCNALTLICAQVGVIRGFNLPLSVFAGLMLLGAGLVATGWRWAPLVGALLSVPVVALNNQGVRYDLTHPESFFVFALMVALVATALVGCAGGVSALVRNYRGAEPQAPRGTWAALLVLAGVCVGALLVAAVPHDSGASPQLLASLPSLATPGLSFDQPTLKARVGETMALRLDNSHTVPHSFDVDELDVHVPVAAGGQSLVLFRPTTAGSYSFYCGVPGHRAAGMVGTLVVEP
jgi:uncharacterized cupredoxin-like copper-binding protein